MTNFSVLKRILNHFRFQFRNKNKTSTGILHYCKRKVPIYIYMYMYMSLEVFRINKGCHKFTFISVRKCIVVPVKHYRNREGSFERRNFRKLCYILKLYGLYWQISWVLIFFFKTTGKNPFYIQRNLMNYEIMVHIDQKYIDKILKSVW